VTGVQTVLFRSQSIRLRERKMTLEKGKMILTLVYYH
jgi:hypothetical protein